MNWQHLRAFLWLRWRMMVNQWRRAGQVNAVLMIVLSVGLVLMAIPLFVGCFAIGLLAFPHAEPDYLLYAWDGMIVGYVFFWGIGLLTELQRTEPLSLSKFMHLPVSVTGAFLINYVSSLLRLSVIFFVPVMFGCGLALAFTKGALSLIVLPLTAAFFLMVTALTYQFQGWLASLMSNPRRRRTVIMVTTTVFVLIVQLPNLLNVWIPRVVQQQASHSQKLIDDIGALDREFEAGQIDQSEHLRRQQKIMHDLESATQLRNVAGMQNAERTARLANIVLPIGWLPLGVMRAAQGNMLPAVLGCLGMTLIGAACLWRAYRTTVRMYLGQYTVGKGAARPAVATAAAATLTPVPSIIAAPGAAAPGVATSGVVTAAKSRKAAANLLDAQIPGLSEPVSAIALAGVRSLMRSPESRMMLLTSVIMGAFFGSMLLKSSSGASESLRTLIAIGAIAMSLFSVVQLMANQFGFDRDGFRVFVLCAASRRDILLGKNLAFAPLVFVMAAILLSIIEVMSPLRWDHLLSMIPQSISMFLLFCLLMNLLSIYAPMQIAAGAIKPARPKLLAVLLHMTMFMFFFPLSQAPTLLPLAIEALLEWRGWTFHLPVCLALSLVECAAIVLIYRICLTWEGALLQAGEQRILDVVTDRAT